MVIAQSTEPDLMTPMTTLLRSSTAFALLLALTAPAWAQDDATATDDATGEATEAEAPADDNVQTDDAPSETGLDMGTPVDADGNPIDPEPTEVQVGQQYIADTFTDWSLRCLKAPEGEADPCQIYQLLQDADGNDVAEISMIPLTGGQAAAGATIVAPLETLLTEDITLRVDGGTARRFEFSFCNRGGCVARVGFTAEDVNLFRRGANATIRIVPAAAPDAEVVLDISLSGFTAAFEAAGQ